MRDKVDAYFTPVCHEMLYYLPTPSPATVNYGQLHVGCDVIQRCELGSGIPAQHQTQRPLEGHDCFAPIRAHPGGRRRRRESQYVYLEVMSHGASYLPRSTAKARTAAQPSSDRSGSIEGTLSYDICADPYGNRIYAVTTSEVCTRRRTQATWSPLTYSRLRTTLAVSRRIPIFCTLQHRGNILQIPNGEQLDCMSSGIAGGGTIHSCRKRTEP